MIDAKSWKDGMSANQDHVTAKLALNPEVGDRKDFPQVNKRMKIPQ